MTFCLGEILFELGRDEDLVSIIVHLFSWMLDDRSRWVIVGSKSAAECNTNRLLLLLPRPSNAGAMVTINTKL